MISPDFLALLRCPATGQTLAHADHRLLSRINARRKPPEGQNEALPNGAKIPMTEDISAALVREDGKVLYPIRDGIPVLLPAEAILC